MFGNKLARVEKLTAAKKTDKLIELTRDKSEEVRVAAVKGLGQCEDDAAYNALVPLVHASEASMRKAAVQALGDMGRVSGRVHIEHQMRVEKDAQVLAAMKQVLSTLADRV